VKAGMAAAVNMAPEIPPWSRRRWVGAGALRRYRSSARHWLRASAARGCRNWVVPR